MRRFLVDKTVRLQCRPEGRPGRGGRRTKWAISGGVGVIQKGR